MYNSKSRKQGSTLVAAVLILGVLGIIFSSIIAWAMTERKLNVRHEDRLESKTTAEALLEYGFAQMKNKFERNTNLANDFFSTTGSNALALPPSNTFSSRFGSNSLEIFAGTISDVPTTLEYLDPTDPANQNDPMAGDYIFTRDVTVYAKATITPRVGATPITTYVSQKLFIRNSPLFTHAIFYNLDLDIHNGPEMNIYGPVHTNGELRLSPGSGALNFHSKVSTTKSLKNMLYYDGNPSFPSRSGDVTFVNATDEQKSFRNNLSYGLANILGEDDIVDSILDSNLGENFRAVASKVWDGNVSTSLDDVHDLYPAGFEAYEPDDPDTPFYDPINTSHDLIEPPIASGSSSYDAVIENQKMANKAGLYFKWDVETDALKAYDSAGGTELDISGLKDVLWSHKEDAFTDHRRGKDIDIIDFNVGVLKDLIESPTDTLIIPDYNPSSDWNGVVYFESYIGDNDSGHGNDVGGVDSSNTGDSTGTALVSQDHNPNAVSGNSPGSQGNGNNPQANALKDTTETSLGYSGIRLYGGSTASSATGQGIPSKGTDTGFTVATNNALYVRGDFNADGVIESDSATAIDDGNEVPVSLMADTVTFLSNSWDDTIITQKPVASNTEVSAAVISGITAPYTTRNGVIHGENGGAHNFPRFLENWGGKTFAIRGSLVAMWEPEVDWSKFGGSYYSPPKREYGFNDLFKQGTFPPGTPMLRDYRRQNFRLITKTEFDQAVLGL